MIMKGIFAYDRWGMLQRFVGKLVDSDILALGPCQDMLEI